MPFSCQYKNGQSSVKMRSGSGGASIKDNGPGIPAHLHEKLFDMFFRASNKSQGSGLGLYIVKNSIEKLGGTVTLKSEVGVGTEFLVELPK